MNMREERENMGTESSKNDCDLLAMHPFGNFVSDLIGEGAFSRVCRGNFQGSTVAVKQLKIPLSAQDKNYFAAEVWQFLRARIHFSLFIVTAPRFRSSCDPLLCSQRCRHSPFIVMLTCAGSVVERTAPSARRVVDGSLHDKPSASHGPGIHEWWQFVFVSAQSRIVSFVRSSSAKKKINKIIIIK